MLELYGERFGNQHRMLKKSIYFLIFIVLLISYLPSYTRMQDKKRQNLGYQEKIKQLKLTQIQLKEEKRLLKEDPEYLEKVAREKMGLVREGEIIYRITPANQEP